VVHICDTSHEDEGKVVEEPPNDGVDTSIMDVINVSEGKISIATLPADEVEEDEGAEERKRGGTCPVDKRVTKEEVLDD
jgi:hypothetical protein